MKNGALERGRAIMERGAPFNESDRAELLIAGQDPGFDPATSTVDRAINRFLDGTFGAPWRERVKPRTMPWTPEEAGAIAAAEAVVVAKRLQIAKVVDDWFVSESALKRVAESDLPTSGLTGTYSDPRLARQVAEYQLRVADLAKRHAELSDDLSRAIAAMTDRKLEAQNRWRDELLART